MNPWHRHPFVLPMPTRANNLVRPALIGPKWKPSARLVKTEAGEEWLAIATSHLRRLKVRLGSPEPLSGPVLLEVKFFFGTISSDGDGPLKALQDALKGFAWEDDRQIADWKIGKRVLEMLGTDEDPPYMRERAEVVVIDVSSDPEHEELAARLLEAKQRAPKKKAQEQKRIVLKPAVYR